MVSRNEIKNIVENGPRSVESAFENWTNGSDRQRELEERYVSYIDLLNKKSLDLGQVWTAFLSGYFNHQAGIHCPNEQMRLFFFKESLIRYGLFLKACKHVSPDIAFFAQWQIGLLLQVLESDWAVAEESFLKALEYYPGRGETIREIIVYWGVKANWRMAYIYSSYCKEHFWHRPPASAKWFVNIPFYRWKILKYHVPVLLNLNRIAEAKECVKALFNCETLGAPLEPSEAREINSLKEALGQWL
ncbi:MAG TPA: hypothetical protein VNV35_12140 [Puia sp.]|jgi:hypothetical protein|nr:hypothetical protein [Puia sp.]